MLMQLIYQYIPDWLRPFARKVRRAFGPVTLQTTGKLRLETPVVVVGVATDAVATNAVPPDPAYAAKIAAERATFDNQAEIHELPPIFHYWSNKYLRPMLEEYGVSNPDQFFVKFLTEAAHRTGSIAPKFLSVGSGNCDTEVRIALQLKRAGLQNFTIECLELSPPMLARGQADAAAQGVAEHMILTVSDFNQWQPNCQYDAVLANQSLHHVQELEHLFDAIKTALLPAGLFITSDMIGRNGHMRWPESLAVVNRFWLELPESYRYNLQLRRHEALYKNWDCSSEGFEGIRAQDVLPELIKRFNFKLFIAASSVVDIFIDRGFGHHFDVTKASDLDFVDRLHAYDERALMSGELTPTRLIAVMYLSDEVSPQGDTEKAVSPQGDTEKAVSPQGDTEKQVGQFSRGLKPENCVRDAKKRI
jgi:SAM-dependent methyltransferase